MALSGSLSTSKYEGRYYTLSWTATQDVATNKSTISWTIKAVGGSSSWYAERTLKAVIAGTTVYSKTDRVERKTGTVKTGTITLSHNTDGTKSFSASMEVAVYTSAVNCKGSSTFTLNTIPRASSVSATNANVGANSTISISRASSAFTHTLTYSFGSLTGTIASKTTSTSVAWTIPTTFYAQMTTVKSKSGTITCDTYSGSTKIGTKTCSFTASVPSTSAPTLNPSCYVASDSDTYKLTGSTTKFIKNYTYISYNMNASAQNSASLTSYTATCGEYSATTATGQFAGALTTNSASFSVTDSRGYTTSKTVNLDVVDYVKLTCSLSANMTVDGKVTAQISGNAFSGSFGATSNTLTIQYRYKEKNGSYSAWTTTSATTKGAVTYTANVSITGLDYKKRYVIQARATDKIQTVTSNEVNLNCLPVFDWGEDNFNINVPLHMNGNQVLRATDTNRVVLSAEGADIFIRPNGSTTDAGQVRFMPDGRIAIDGSIMNDFVVEQGTSGIWTYRKWASGKIELWTREIQHKISFTTTSTGISYSTQSGIQVPLVKTIEFATGDSTKWYYANWASVTNNDGTTLGIRYYGLNTNGNGNTIPFSAYVIGTWK